MNINEHTAHDFMREDVISIKQSETITTAARLMRKHGVSSLVVTRCSASDAWGIVTRKDIVDSFTENLDYHSAALVEDIMSKPALTVTPALAISHCLQTMKMAGIRRLPVVDGDKLLGILSNTDIFSNVVDRMD